MNMEFKRKLPTPQTIKDMYPVSETLAAQKEENDRQIRAVLTGEDDRLMLIVGPCSADREDAVLDYVGRLRKLQERVADKILLVPRVYSNKPPHHRRWVQGYAAPAGSQREARPAQGSDRHP